MNIKRGFIALLIGFLTACSNNQVITVVPIPIASATKAATAVVASLTPRLSPSKTPSPTSQPMQMIPIATSNAIATVEAIRIDLISQVPELEEYNTFCNITYCYGVEVSPNRNWIYFSNGNVIEIFGVNGQKVGKYSFYEIYGHTIDLWDGYLSDVHWSKDGRYLYLATYFGDGGPGPYFGYRSSLVRVNLENGTWKDTGISGVLSFSPNEKYIVYSTNKSEIRIKNLQSGEEKVYFTPEYYLYFGNFVWSPDSKKIVFVATSEYWDDVNSKFALFMIDLESETTVNLYEDLMPFYYPIEWTEDGKVSLNKYQQDGIWILDFLANPPTINP